MDFGRSFWLKIHLRWLMMLISEASWVTFAGWLLHNKPTHLFWLRLEKKINFLSGSKTAIENDMVRLHATPSRWQQIRGCNSPLLFCEVFKKKKKTCFPHAGLFSVLERGFPQRFPLNTIQLLQDLCFLDLKICSMDFPPRQLMRLHAGSSRWQ